MYFWIQQSHLPYKCLIISIFFMFCFIGVCQAEQGITVSEQAQQNLQNLALTGDKVAFLRQITQPLTPGQAGRKAIEFAEKKMKGRSPQGEKLAPEIKEILYLYFAKDLVDRIQIHWKVDLLDTWKFQDYSITLKNIDTEAQTYGYHIYTKYSQSDIDTLHLMSILIHHVTHVRQFKELEESLSEFGDEYFTEYFKEVGEIYEKNEMELEANANVGLFLSTVNAIRKEE